MTKDEWYAQLFERFGNSRFRSSFHLKQKDIDYINEKGFHQYEISNFAKNKESESKHNYGYWQHKEYLGVGAGAVGYVNQQRHYPSKSIEEYIKNPLAFEVEEIDLDESLWNYIKESRSLL